MIKLMMLLVLFTPGWTKENPEGYQHILAVQQQEYSTMTECKDVLAQSQDMVGVYSKTYPHDDDYNIGFQMECVREKQDTKLAF
jgi:hypothetical protein